MSHYDAIMRLWSDMIWNIWMCYHVDGIETVLWSTELGILGRVGWYRELDNTECVYILTTLLGNGGSQNTKTNRSTVESTCYWILKSTIEWTFWKVTELTFDLA